MIRGVCCGIKGGAATPGCKKAAGGGCGKGALYCGGACKIGFAGTAATCCGIAGKGGGGIWGTCVVAGCIIACCWDGADCWAWLNSVRKKINAYYKNDYLKFLEKNKQINNNMNIMKFKLNFKSNWI